MKVITYGRFGDTSVLEAAEVPVPDTGKRGLLVKVHAASVNVIDSRTRRGEMSPFVNKKFPKIPGVDFAGTIVAVGTDVVHSKIGDAIYGAVNPFQGGAFAEFVAVGEDAVAPKPQRLSFEEAAGVPLAGLAGLYSLRELGKVQRGQDVLIYGSSGGVGLAAIQLAKYFGARVTTVCGTAGVGTSRELGADLALDYKKGPVRFPGKFDVILEFSSRFAFDTARAHLKPSGRFVEASPTIPKFLGSMLANLFRKQKHLMLTAEAKRADLEFLSSLVETGRLNPVIAKVFPMESAREAFDYQESGGAIGKTVVSLGGA
jgi:hypothetical protein